MQYIASYLFVCFHKVVIYLQIMIAMLMIYTLFQDYSISISYITLRVGYHCYFTRLRGKAEVEC